MPRPSRRRSRAEVLEPSIADHKHPSSSTQQRLSDCADRPLKRRGGGHVPRHRAARAARSFRTFQYSERVVQSVSQLFHGPAPRGERVVVLSFIFHPVSVNQSCFVAVPRVKCPQTNQSCHFAVPPRALDYYTHRLAVRLRRSRSNTCPEYTQSLTKRSSPHQQRLPVHALCVTSSSA